MTTDAQGGHGADDAAEDGEVAPGGYGSFVMGALGGLLALAGLALAAGAGHGMMHGIGMLLFAAGVLFVFWLMKRAFDREEMRRHGR